MGRHLNLMEKDSSAYSNVKAKFNQGWQHYGKTGTMKNLYLFDTAWTSDSLSRYKMVFHGTRRACNLGESYETHKCPSDECSLCRILRKGRFSVKTASPKCMFGRGIYTSPISSKADFYAKNIDNESDVHVLILCLSTHQKAQPLYRADRDRRQADPGYDVVEGMTRDQGGSLWFPELVAYDNYKFFPIGIVVYQRS